MLKREIVRTGLVVLAFLVSCLWSTAQQPFTLEQVMSAPFPSELSAAPAGGRFAWVFNNKGARNLWVAAPPDYAAIQISNYPNDDGQEIDQIAWTPDGSKIVYVRGGDFEMGRKDPNPASFPQGVSQDIWVVPATGGEPQKIATGHSPAVSPKGDAVAYILKGQVWIARLNGDAKPAQLIHALGNEGNLQWSPDGTQLAYVSRRGDHSLIGVYDFGAKTVRYLDPGVDHDGSPVWSPNGKEIAFIRIPTAGLQLLFGPHREGQPWSIRVADVATGKGHEVWKASPGPGSVFHRIVAKRELFWGAGGRLVFPWERDGWLHLYSVSTRGGKATLLTPGDFEVEDVSISPDRSEILINSNQNDIDRRHVWKLSVAGGTPVELTKGEGIEWTPKMASDGKTIALLRSNARRPARPALISASGQMRDLAPQAIPADFPTNQLVVPKQVILSAADGMKFHGQLFLPRNTQEGKRHPAVIFFHGGSRRQMLLGWHYMHYYNNAYAMNQYLASRGYIVLSVNYRSGIGYGLNFREAINYGATGGSEFNDELGAGLYLRGRPDVDPERIGLWGGSYGGYLTAMGLSRASNLFAAGVDLHGVYDWNTVIRNFNSSYNPLEHPKVAKLAFESSPAASIKTWRSPVLLIQGDDDRNVPFNQTVNLAVALRKQGVPFQLLVLPDEIHGFLMHRSWQKAYHAAADFFGQQFHMPN